MESGRWVERLVATGNGDEYIIVGSFYGYSGAANDPSVGRLNERLLAIAVARAASFCNLSIIVCEDIPWVDCRARPVAVCC